MTSSAYQTVAFQGSHGAYSHLACLSTFPDLKPLACTYFHDVFTKAEQDSSVVGFLPVENSIAGRVAEIHQLLAHTRLHIIREHYQPIVHCLLACPNSSLSDITTIKSHAQALLQCQTIIVRHHWKQVVVSDTASAAAHLARNPQSHVAVIASRLAAELYGLKVLRPSIADTGHNTTRFIAVHQQESVPAPTIPAITSLVCRTKNEPSALYRVLGFFAEHQLNLTRLEGLIDDHRFQQAQFYLDIEGHRLLPPLKDVLKTLQESCQSLRVLGCYPADSFRTGATS
ncbi:MAG: prephenate dehydratase [Alphaproteobacteria bacterium GM202ARS2]|nr:prephenate dehydratase [Alphaproteobacteria bacterium GM202ARS2]